MIVRIRFNDDDDSVYLCDWPADRLDELIPAIGRWGVVGHLGEYETNDLVGQIRFDDLCGYFEIVVMTDSGDGE